MRLTDTKNFISDSAEKTRAFAKEFASSLIGGEVITLSGDLGAGKTVFAKGLAEGLEISGNVTSPTFTIMHTYSGKFTLYHFDMYRVKDISELVELGYYEAISDPQGITVIEWAENIACEIPQNAIKITINYIDNNTREITVKK